MHFVALRNVHEEIGWALFILVGVECLIIIWVIGEKQSSRIGWYVRYKVNIHPTQIWADEIFSVFRALTIVSWFPPFLTPPPTPVYDVELIWFY